MKKLLVAAAVAALVSGTVAAQERPGGGTEYTIGGVTYSTIGVVAAGALVGASIISNSRGATLIIDEETETVFGCEGTDELNADGFCVGTTTVVSGTGTNTYTATATFTYEAVPINQ